jgi:hypothetical protein
MFWRLDLHTPPDVKEESSTHLRPLQEAKIGPMSIRPTAGMRVLHLFLQLGSQPPTHHLQDLPVLLGKTDLPGHCGNILTTIFSLKISRVSQEQRSVFWAVIVSVILSKRSVCVLMSCSNNFQDRAISLYKPAIFHVLT